MGKVVDARGLTCPQPVIMTKKAMGEPGGDELITIVNQAVALENVSKLARSQGYETEVEQKDDDYYIHMTRMGKDDDTGGPETEELAIMIRSNLFGQGEAELGQVLMKSFLFSLNELDTRVTHIIFMNSGIFLTIEGSPVLETLKVLEGKGVEILSCGTCLDFYQAKDKLAVGSVTNMYTALEILTTAGRSITL
ncbi:sulfurtransferase-like selenium metabolism protein YedF [Syntrophomonas curvata]